LRRRYVAPASFDADTAATLGRILEDETSHREEIAAMLARSDPQAASI